MYLVFALTLLAALAEGIGILMLMPLLAGIDGGFDSTESPLGGGRVLPDILASLGLSGSTLFLLLIISLAFLVKGAFTFGALGLRAYLRGQLLCQLKNQLFAAYGRMSYHYYAGRDTGHFTNVINEQINHTLAAFSQLTQLGAQVVNTLVYLGLAFFVAWRFGLMALVMGMILLALFKWLNIYVRMLSRSMAHESGHLTKLLIQSLHAFKYLQATGQLRAMRAPVTGSIQTLTDIEIRRGIADAFTQALREPVAVVCIMLIVMVQLVVLEQPLSPILVSILLFYRGLNAVIAIQAGWQKTLNHIGSVELVDKEFQYQKSYQEPEGCLSIPPLNRAIELQNVSFSYDATLGDALSAISLAIPVRTSVALVGASGAGKSTLVDLLTFALKPCEGFVLIDGVPGEQIKLETWRKQIGYVSQEAVVFDETIANNICLWTGTPESDQVLMERIHHAAAQAHLDQFIESLPDGYHTVVGDRGVRLSGGQRQRLFIARELFRKPNLLILDEATSALDSESERAIQQSIDALKGQTTVIIIAHRLSTIRNVDRVYVFDQGRLVEQGSYQELKDSEDSRFGVLVAMQAL